ncbi:GspH/FimT family pseudopilin [Halomonas sp. 25-S5]|uniref:GspH/FimT family pseudopilin n=1 Tax=Halomonas sp. 25-S5 TaxID=2994065 RepID=UPI00246926B7|nr:GspH/FimT family pseudopilin [Halomonas sp. 25-S5]
MKNDGFTLIELLVTIALIVIVSSIAVPNFLGMINSNRAASDVNEILSGLSYARAEAVKCRGDVVFSISSGVGGYTVTSTACNNIRELDRSLEVGADSSQAITFGPLGKNDCDSGSACEITVDGRKIYVYSTGYVGR